MEIKRPNDITEADIANIENPFFASGRVRRVFEGYGATHIIGIRGLDEIVAKSMRMHLGGDNGKHSAYWKYYKSGGKERDRDFDFRRDDPIKDNVSKDFEWGKYLIVLQSEADRYRFAPLYTKDETPGIASHDQWKQFSEASPTFDYIGFEVILNRIYPNRKRLDYHPFYGRPGSGSGESASEEITLTPEPWPQEKIPTEEEQSLADMIKDYFGRVARGEILEENLERYGKMLDGAMRGDPEATRDFINEFAGVGGIAKVGKAVSKLGKTGAKSQTGAGSLIGSADEAYDAIRASTTDVNAIAKNTGIKPSNIQKVKDHLFHNEHLLDRYVDYGEPAVIGKFDSDIGIADAWKRLKTGNHTVDDLNLLKHETAEAWYMRNNGPGYTKAHDAAQNRYPAPRMGEE